MRARFPIGTNMRTCPMFVALMVLASASSVSAEEPKVGVAVLHSGEDPVGVGEAGFERRLQHFVENCRKNFQGPGSHRAFIEKRSVFRQDPEMAGRLLKRVTGHDDDQMR